MYPTTSLIFVLFFAAAFTPPASAPPANPGFFHIVDLQYSGDLLSYAVEDLNNDQLQDILIFSLHYGNSSGKERWLSIFLQKTTGFDAEPDQSFQLPQDLVICDTGDIAGDGRKELVYFGAGELRYLHMQGNAFDQKPISLWQTESIFILPDHNKVRRWDFVRDFNGDGHDDLFVQDFLQARLFLRQPRVTGARIRCRSARNHACTVTMTVVFLSGTNPMRSTRRRTYYWMISISTAGPI